jgi:hypothetical protein
MTRALLFIFILALPFYSHSDESCYWKEIGWLSDPLVVCMCNDKTDLEVEKCIGSDKVSWKWKKAGDGQVRCQLFDSLERPVAGKVANWIINQKHFKDCMQGQKGKWDWVVINDKAACMYHNNQGIPIEGFIDKDAFKCGDNDDDSSREYKWKDDGDGFVACILTKPKLSAPAKIMVTFENCMPFFDLSEYGRNEVIADGYCYTLNPEGKPIRNGRVTIGKCESVNIFDLGRVLNYFSPPSSPTRNVIHKK